MRFFFAPRLGWPAVGVAVAVGLLVGDCLFVVSPYMDSFHAGWLWPLLLGALGMYLCLGAGLDLAVQLAGRGAAAGSMWIRMAVILAVAAGLVLAAGEVRSLLLLVVAAVFATLALGRFTWPLAVGAAAVALYPVAVGSPASAVDGHVPAAARPGTPSFVVAVLDTVRRDHTSAYGYHRDTTPHLSRLAERGVRFDRHGAHNEHLELDERHPTLAQLLARHGYQTANFTANAWIGPGTGMSRGFQRNHESWRRYHLDLMLLAKRVYFALAAPDRDKGGSDLVVGIRRWLAERDPTRPYFLFVNVFEAHGPYQYVPRAFRRRFADPDLSLQALEAFGTRVFTATQNGNRLSEGDVAVGVDLLDGAIAAADFVLGQVLELVGDDAIAVVLSDHGELFGEHALFGHSNTLYEPLIRVPMVMAGPTLPKGLVVEEVVWRRSRASAGASGAVSPDRHDGSPGLAAPPPGPGRLSLRSKAGGGGPGPEAHRGRGRLGRRLRPDRGPGGGATLSGEPDAPVYPGSRDGGGEDGRDTRPLAEEGPRGARVRAVRVLKADRCRARRSRRARLRSQKDWWGVRTGEASRLRSDR